MFCDPFVDFSAWYFRAAADWLGGHQWRAEGAPIGQPAVTSQRGGL